MNPPWHTDAARLRRAGLSVPDIAVAVGKSATAVYRVVPSAALSATTGPRICRAGRSTRTGRRRRSGCGGRACSRQ